MPTLANLIITEMGKKTTAEAAVAAGDLARAQLTELEGILDSLESTSVLRDATGLAATDALLEASAGADALTAGALAQGTTLREALLDAAELEVADLDAIVAGALPGLPKTYAEYATAKKAADSDAANKAAEAAAKRAAADRSRNTVELLASAVRSIAADAVDKLASARTLAQTAILRAKAGNLAASWWAGKQAAALVTEVKAADPTAAITALNNACDVYANAVSDWQAQDDAADLAAGKAKTAADDLATAGKAVLAQLTSAAQP